MGSHFDDPVDEQNSDEEVVGEIEEVVQRSVLLGLEQGFDGAGENGLLGGACLKHDADVSDQEERPPKNGVETEDTDHVPQEVDVAVAW